jgi:hypothetical protein
MEIMLNNGDFRVREENNQPQIFDPVRRKWVAFGPEEWVRQIFIKWLVEVCAYPLSSLSVERSLEVNGRMKRFDIMVLDRQAQPWMLVECKAMDVSLSEEVLMQVLSYQSVLSSSHMVITNGKVCHVATIEKGTAQWVPSFPNYPN